MTDQNQEKVATRGQRRKIRGMLDGDQISFELAQAIVERRVRIYTHREELIIAWESQFPGKGEEIFGIIEPMVNWELVLKPALEDLEQRAASIDWVKGVHTFTMSHEGSLSKWLDSVLESTFYEILGSKMPRWLCDGFRDSLSLVLDDTFDKTHKNQPIKLVMSLPEGVAWDKGSDCINNSPTLLCQAIGSIRFYVCAFCLANMSAEMADMQQLLEIFRAGNFPVGFDKEGKLLVLVAE